MNSHNSIVAEAALGVLKSSSMGDVVSGRVPIGGDLSSKILKHQAYDMFYSVMWSTEGAPCSQGGAVDLISKQELWLAKLGSWSEALVVYQEKLARDPSDFEALLGCMRCLDASGEWEQVLELFDQNLAKMSVASSVGHTLQLRDDIAPRSKRKAIRMCAQAAWRLGHWDDLDLFSSELLRRPMASPAAVASDGSSGAENNLPQIDFEGAFYSGVLRIHQKKWADAAEAIDLARKAMDGRLTALMAESYGRAYPSMVTAQTLAEMEEIIDFRKSEERLSAPSYDVSVSPPSSDPLRERLLNVWRDRLAGCRVDSEVHASILAVRSLILGPTDEIDATLQLSTLSRQAHRFKFAERVLLRPLSQLNADLDGPAFGSGFADSLRTRIDFRSIESSALPSVIDRVVQADLSFIVPPYGLNHEQLTRSIVSDAGGPERYAFDLLSSLVLPCSYLNLAL